MTATKLALVIATLAALGGCGATTKGFEVGGQTLAEETARQKELYVAMQHEGQQRVQRIAWRMLRDSAPLCAGELRPGIGFIPVNSYEWPVAYRAAAEQVLGVGERVSVGLVVEDSPAGRAGILSGDILLSIAGQSVPSGDKAARKTWKLIGKYAEADVPVLITARRGMESLVFELTPVPMCDSYTALIAGGEVNAYANGRAIFVTTGMLRFVTDDDELAAVIGHELAHNALDHNGKKIPGMVLGGVLDVAAIVFGFYTGGAFAALGTRPFSKQFEAEADYVGLYALALAGYSTQNVAGFWRRVGMESPGLIATQWISTHPGTAERYLAMEAAAREIQAKIAAGEPLRPNADNRPR